MTTPTKGTIWQSKIHPEARVEIRECRAGWVEYEVIAAPHEAPEELGYFGGTAIEEFEEFFTPVDAR